MYLFYSGCHVEFLITDESSKMSDLCLGGTHKVYHEKVTLFWCTCERIYAQTTLRYPFYLFCVKDFKFTQNVKSFNYLQSGILKMYSFYL